MTDPNGSTPSSPPPAPRRRRKWLWITLAIVILAPAILLTVWTLITLSYTYSTGDRAGYVQKFSRKGWICKTWEGELAMVNIPGAMQERWEFTVRKDSVAAQITALSGKQVVLFYSQHKKVPFSCLGETEYFVDSVRKVMP